MPQFVVIGLESILGHGYIDSRTKEIFGIRVSGN